jgi:hypothetical protein
MSGGSAFAKRLFRMAAMLDRTAFKPGAHSAGLGCDGAPLRSLDLHRLSRTERLEMIFAAAAGIGECPSWVILALEHDERAERCEEERLSC